MAEAYHAIEARILGLYSLLYEDELTRNDTEFDNLEEAYNEGEIYLPYIGITVDLWRDWPTEKRVEGPQQNAVVNGQLDAAQSVQTSATHQ